MIEHKNLEFVDSEELFFVIFFFRSIKSGEVFNGEKAVFGFCDFDLELFDTFDDFGIELRSEVSSDELDLQFAGGIEKPCGAWSK